VSSLPKRRDEQMDKESQLLNFEPYAPIRRRLLNLLRAANLARKQAGLEPAPTGCLRLRRRIYRPFHDHTFVPATRC
jgi:hypothetical protein